MDKPISDDPAGVASLPPIQHSRAMRRIAVIVIVVSLVALGLALCPVYVWHGCVTVNVNLKSRSSSPIHQVAYAVARRREQADWISKNERECPFEAVKDFDGTKFVIDLSCGGRRWLGIDYGYVEPKGFVVLLVGYGKEKRWTTVTEIPKGPGPRSVTVEIP